MKTRTRAERASFAAETLPTQPSPALNRSAALSPRERECLQLRASGRSYKQAAAELKISINTLQEHLKRAFRKLGVQSSLEAIKAL